MAWRIIIHHYRRRVIAQNMGYIRFPQRSGNGIRIFKLEVPSIIKNPHADSFPIPEKTGACLVLSQKNAFQSEGHETSMVEHHL